MRIVARYALDVSRDQLHRSGGVGRVPAGRQRSGQVHVVLQRHGQAERVRRLHIAAEHVLRVHRSARSHLAVSHRGPNRNRAVMAAQTLISGVAKRWLPAAVFLGAARVRRVDLRGELLVPQAAIQSGVRRMAVGAGVRTRSGKRRIAARTQVMHTHHVARNLRRQSRPRKQKYQRGHWDSEPQFIPSPAGAFEPAYWNTCTRRLNESTTKTWSPWSMNNPAGN